AEQEGQQTETEATGAPQKHHYTLNQQVGSITYSLISRVRDLPGTATSSHMQLTDCKKTSFYIAHHHAKIR
ncbi:hypothetical protein, partial [Klebsiella pneumoniae]|uniref:hypothetical protein n=1 Tax=Klebsiella pneumoniae TaxID=573 RepID=UPI001C6ED08E